MNTKDVLISIGKVILMFAACTLFWMLVGCTTTRYRNPYYKTGIEKVAVIPFDSNDQTLSVLNMSDYFTVQIFRTIKKIDLLERRNLTKILQERSLAITGVVNDSGYVQLEKASSLLLGSADSIKSSERKGVINVIIKLMSTDTGKIAWADKIELTCYFSKKGEVMFSEEHLSKAAEEMVNRIKGFLYTESFNSRKEMIDKTAEYYLNREIYK